MRNLHLLGRDRWLQYATVLMGAFWMALISYAWVTQPDAIGTFMFQFLHMTSFLLYIQDTEILLRAFITGFFLITDILTLVLRISAPVLPAWSAFHILAVIHSALYLVLALYQTTLAWLPILRGQEKRKPIIT